MSIPRRTITRTVRKNGPETTETTVTSITSTVPKASTSRIPQSRLPLPKTVGQESASSLLPTRIAKPTPQSRIPPPPNIRPPAAPQRLRPPSSHYQGRSQLSTAQNSFGGQARKTPQSVPPPKQRIPVINVYQAPETTPQPDPKPSVKTLKTQKVEKLGTGKRTVTTVRKTVGPDPTKVAPTPRTIPTPGPSTKKELTPFDFPVQTASPSTSIEDMVQKELMESTAIRPGIPLRAKGSRRTETRAPILKTPEGNVEGSLQISLNRKVERGPDVEYIKRYMTGVEVDEEGNAKKYEYSIQEIEPGGGTAPRSDGVIPLHETISVKRTLSFAPGVKIKENTTVYESVEPDTEQISQMIEDEAHDIENIKSIRPPDLKGSASSVYGLKKKIQKMQLSPQAVRQLETVMVRPPISPDEGPAEVQPELMAAIMHTEEKGLSMESPPSKVYNYLFPDVQDDPTIQVKPAAPRPMQKVVVPENIPSELLSEAVPTEIERLATDIECERSTPADDIFSTSVLKGNAQPKINNTARRGPPSRRGYPILSAEEPPWKVEELQPIMDLVGAAPSSRVHTMTAVDISDASPAFHNVDENVLEYHLVPQPPRFTSNVQLRGSQKPPWFPGFYIALPDNIRVLPTPCDVLPAAWQAVQPDIFSDDSFLIVG